MVPINHRMILAYRYTPRPKNGDGDRETLYADSAMSDERARDGHWRSGLGPCQEQPCRRKRAARWMHGVVGAISIAIACPVIASDGPATGATNIVHQFDFDERAIGNVDEVPRDWEPLRIHGFPRYARGQFDLEIGRTRPPSFRLKSSGRNVAYQYVGNTIKTRPRTGYRIESFVMLDKVIHARACLSAYYVDDRGQPLPGSMIRSDWAGPSTVAKDWESLRIQLPPAPVEARTIGLTLWLLQEDAHRQTEGSAEPDLTHIDVGAEAWFDDITIETAPRAELTASAADNVLMAGTDDHLSIAYYVSKTPAPPGELIVQSVNGQIVLEREIPAQPEDTGTPMSIPIADWAVGWYRAQFRVRSQDFYSVADELDFVVVRSESTSESKGARSFGLVIDPHARADWQVELNLLEKLGTRAVKLPMVVQPTDQAEGTTIRFGVDRFLQELGRRSFAITGVLIHTDELSENTPSKKTTFVEWAARKEAGWEDPLGAVVAPVAGLFRSWQLGQDASPAVSSPETLAEAIQNVRSALQKYITNPSLSLAYSGESDPPSSELPLQQLVINLRTGLAPEFAREVIAQMTAVGFSRPAVFVEPLPNSEYGRLSRLADWVRRIVSARHSGAAVLYAPQPWRVRHTSRGVVAEPTEDYIVLRTIARELSDAAPFKSLRLKDGVECLVFDDSDNALFLLWDPQSNLHGREHLLQLGQAKEWIDVWGNHHDLRREEAGMSRITLSPMPIIVRGVEKWVVDFVSSALSLEPNHVESGTELVRHTLKIDYQGTRALSGIMTFDTPTEWEVEPRELSFNLQPGQTESRPLDIRYPHNVPAGSRTILARAVISETGYRLDVPLTIDIGLTDVDVWGSAVVDQNTLVLRHVLTNNTKETLSFRGSATVPGRERQYRPFTNLQPGTTQVTEYRIPGGNELAGSRFRLTLVEMNDGKRRHTLELTVP